MTFRIADTFTDSLGRLTGDEQRAVKTTAFDLQLNPANPGMQFHKLDKAKDKSFWSVRVSSDIRIIVHKTSGSLLLCYVDHHDKAYAWAERRKLEVHPTTGAAQLVEVRERVEEIVIPVYIAQETKRQLPRIFASYEDTALLELGVPVEWLADVKTATEESLFEIVEHLPQEAAEALLDLATGTTPKVRAIVEPTADPFEHPDALRRFRVVTDEAELSQALEFPWDKWTIFLHPAQRELVAKNFSGPARVSGSAGTGKTVVALHRAVHLAREHSESRVLLTTFSDTLANALRIKLRRLISKEPRLGERIDVHSLDAVGERLYERNFGKVKVATDAQAASIVKQVWSEVKPGKFSDAFLLSEWRDVVDAWQLTTWEGYRDVARLGRKTRLPEPQREKLWEAFAKIRAQLASAKLVTRAMIFDRLASHYAATTTRPYDFIVVDESQDLSVPQLRFLAAFGAGKPNVLFFSGDLGQRIFQPAFSWRQLGVDIRGRASTLKINYRTSHQIRSQADRLLDQTSADVDGMEERRAAISVFNGPAPTVRVFADEAGEFEAVAAWLIERVAGGVSPTEIGVFVRSPEQLERAKRVMARANVPFKIIDDRVETVSGMASVGTMHLAKGLEFRTVVVMACDDEVLPLQSRIESVTDDSDLEEVYKTERQLLYVACTRARDELFVSAVRPESEFVTDLMA